MTIVAITGDHPRHAYFVRCLAETGLLTAWVRERRESFVPEAPAGLRSETKRLFDLHFSRREEAEDAVFGSPDVSGIRIHDTSMADLNGPEVVALLRETNPKVVMSYGCHKLSSDLRAAVPAAFWNTHGGLSPDYRGVITHFWPSYMLEPQMTGMTLHQTTDFLDGGEIIHQSGAILNRGDGVHMLAARTVKSYAQELMQVLPNALQREALPAGRRQKSSGKLWLSSDWRPEHLHFVYDTWGDRIVDRVLDGDIDGKEPRLISELK
ncbi:formyl transferase [Citreimonas sp.]|uniref:formyl transferase n=1 Tax=Citreimonas sp. TaxID=3036715 RepID=UPI0035C7F7CC